MAIRRIDWIESFVAAVIRWLGFGMGVDVYGRLIWIFGVWLFPESALASSSALGFGGELFSKVLCRLGVLSLS